MSSPEKLRSDCEPVVMVNRPLREVLSSRQYPPSTAPPEEAHARTFPWAYVPA